MNGKIRKCDSTGDSVIAQYDTEQANTLEVAQDELTKFLDECVKQYGAKPPVWARRGGTSEFLPFKVGKDSLAEMDEVLCQPLLRGG